MKSGLPECQQAGGETFAKYWRCRALDTLRETRRIYDFLTSGPTIDRPQYVLIEAWRSVRLGLGVIVHSVGPSVAHAATFGHACQAAEQRHIASNAT